MASNDTGLHDLGEDIYDSLFTWMSLGLGVPGNILVIVTFWSYPASAAKLLFQLLGFFDAVSLALLISQRPLMWYGILTFDEDNRTTTLLTTYLNIIYYVSIFSNMVLVFLALERLLYVRFPSSHTQYYSPLDRIKLTLFILGLLIMSFCLIITIKMSYFGLAWIVVFLTFYGIWPAICLLSCIILLATHYVKKFQDRKYHEQNKPLAASHSSFVEKSSSHHSGLSVSSPLKGSISSSHVFKGKKKDPYSLYLVEKSASESHLAIKSSIPGNALTKSKSGNCVNTVVTLKVPPSTSYKSLAIHKTVAKDGFMSQEQEEEHMRKRKRNTQLTIMAVVASVLVVLSIFPLAAYAALLAKEDKKSVDLSDQHTYLMITATMLTMYFVHASKFYMYLIISSVFRRHVLAIFTCRQKALMEEEAPSSQH